LFVKLPDLPPAPVNAWIPINGQAWIEQGPLNPTRFKAYALAIRPKGGLVWRQFGRGAIPAKKERRLGWLVPSLLRLTRGVYEIRLTVAVTGDDPLTPWPTSAHPAIRDIIIY